MLPRHDMRREREEVQLRLEQIEEELPSLDPDSRGPARLALGRGLLALGKYGKARTVLEDAWRDGYRTAEMSYAIGRALGELYTRGLEEASRISDREPRKRRERELSQQFGVAALERLRAAQSLPLEAPEHVEGLIALYEHRLDDAMGRARRVSSRLPWFYEGRRLEGDVHAELAESRVLADDVAGALAELELAGAAYAQAALIAPSDALTEERECSRLVAIVRIRSERDQTLDEWVERAARTCDAAIEIDPELAPAYGKKATALWHLARQQSAHGASPIATLETAATLVQKARMLDTTAVAYPMLLGRIYHEQASYLGEHGDNPMPAFDRALLAMQSAVELEPSSYQPRVYLSYALTHRGEYESMHGMDPRHALRQAIGHAERAAELAPEMYDVHNSIGWGHWALASYEDTIELDPRPSLERAATAFAKVQEMRPQLDVGFNNACGLYNDLADVLLERGSSTDEVLDKAQRNCERAIAIDGNSAISRRNLAATCTLRARAATAAGRDARAILEVGRAAARAALAIDGDAFYAWLELGKLEVEAARSDPKTAAAAVARGLLAISRAAAVNPRAPALLRVRGMLLALESEHARGRRQGDLARRALQDFQDALTQSPTMKRDLVPRIAQVRKIMGVEPLVPASSHTNNE